MTCFRLTPAVVALVVLGLGVSPAPSFAQRARGRSGGSVGRAVPRASAPARPAIATPRFGGRIYTPYRYGYGYGYGYRPGFSLGIYAGSPFGYLYPYGYYGYGYYPYGYYPYYSGYPYAYGYPYSAAVYASAYGSLRIEGAPEDAQVFADGYYAGNVDDFDGVFQRLDLTPGAHHIEIRPQSAPPIAFDVRIQPGRTITYHADATPR